MNIKHKISAAAKLAMGITALTLSLASCSSGISTSSGGSSVSGVATPSKVSVVNTN